MKKLLPAVVALGLAAMPISAAQAAKAGQKDEVKPEAEVKKPEGSKAQAKAAKEEAKPAAKAEAKPAAKGLGILVEPYAKLRDAVAKDDLAGAKAAAKEFHKSLGQVEGKKASQDSLWRQESKKMEEAARAITKAKDIQAARSRLAAISASLAAVGKRHPGVAGAELQIYHCPMALDNKGAVWLQKEGEMHNPYFGGKMPKCGSKQGVI